MEIIQKCQEIKDNINSMNRVQLKKEIIEVYSYLSEHYPSTHGFFSDKRKITGPLSKMNNDNADIAFDTTLEEVKERAKKFIDRVINSISKNGLPDNRVWANFIVDIVNKEFPNSNEDLRLAVSELNLNNEVSKRHMQQFINNSNPEHVKNALTAILSLPAVLQTINERREDFGI